MNPSIKTQTDKPRSQRALVLYVAVAILIGSWIVEGAVTAGPATASVRARSYATSSPRLSLNLRVVGSHLTFDAHGVVTCANGSTHSQLFIQGFPLVHIASRGKFHSHLFLPREPGLTSGTGEFEAPTASQFIGIKGRRYGRRIVGSLRFWEGSRRRHGHWIGRCGTGAAVGFWQHFSAERIR